MPKLPRLSGKEIQKILEKLGFVYLRQKGSHVSMKKETVEGAIGCVVPMHKEVAIGTLKGILKQAHLSDDEFLEAYSE
jgi:predicted RNA binding protein YcfA (HicA-like mRNA interferase family)